MSLEQGFALTRHRVLQLFCCDDLDGGGYTITISAQTSAGAIGTAATIVTVPHSR